MGILSLEEIKEKVGNRLYDSWEASARISLDSIVKKSTRELSDLEKGHKLRMMITDNYMMHEQRNNNQASHE